jgi:hypothetical protein
MTEPCMCNDRGHYQGSYSERKECGVIGAYDMEMVLGSMEMKLGVDLLERRSFR